MNILLTNDDGISSPGIAALYEELQSVADVTVIAPVEDRSGAGRARSRTVEVSDHDLGYTVKGTPADCVAYGVEGLSVSFDLVVSGCNHGPNCGSYVLGRSGTVGAVVEASFLDVPGIAISSYHYEELFPPKNCKYTVPATVARRLVKHSGAGGVFDEVDYLNVNTPIQSESRYRLTYPKSDYRVRIEKARKNSGTVRFVNDFWASISDKDQVPAPVDVEANYLSWSSRGALVSGEIAVSPLIAPQQPVESSAVTNLITTCNSSSGHSGRA